MKSIRHMKSRVLALLLSLCMITALLPTVAFAADYDDTDGHWAEAEIDRWTEAGVVHGDGNGDFNPNSNMTRAESAQVFVNLLRLSAKADLSAYTDAGNGAWYDDALSKVVADGIMKGTSAATLSPETTLSREMMFVMIARALGVEEAETSDKDFADSDETHRWATGYINALVNMGVISGVDSNHIAPLADINRASVMAALDRLIGGYANEDGQTVEIVPGKITLIVAGDVAVTGEADPELPIIVTGEAGKVDMSKVEGNAVVQVNKSDVAIENAPAGTEIKAAEDAQNVTANGIDVSDDADKDVVIPEKKPTPSNPGSVTPLAPTTPSLDQVIADEIPNISEKMKSYATADWDAASHTLKVTISNDQTTITAVYNDIAGMLCAAFNKTRTTITKVQDKLNPKDGVILDIADDLQNSDLYTFVSGLYIQKDSEEAKSLKTLMTDGAGSAGQGKIVKLIGYHFTIDVTSGGSTTAYTIEFSCPSLDQVIADEIGAISNKMSYASLTWDGANHVLDVDISEGTTKLTTVYNDISGMLCTAFNKTRTTIAKVQDKLNSDQGVTLDIEDDLQNSDLYTFVAELYIKKDGGEATTLKQLMADNAGSTGQGQISKLVGYHFEIEVTPKSGTAVTYTIKFSGQPSLDDVINSEIGTISEKMDYASLTWTADNHTLAVVISDGEKSLMDVYNDIAEMLCTAFNKTRTTLSEVKDALNSSGENVQTLGLSSALTKENLATFVAGLYLQKDTGAAQSLREVMGAQAGSLSAGKISSLDGYHFTINVKSSAEGAQPVSYTITFANAQ